MSLAALRSVCIVAVLNYHKSVVVAAKVLGVDIEWLRAYMRRHDLPEPYQPRDAAWLSIMDYLPTAPRSPAKSAAVPPPQQPRASRGANDDASSAELATLASRAAWAQLDRLETLIEKVPAPYQPGLRERLQQVRTALRPGLGE